MIVPTVCLSASKIEQDGGQMGYSRESFMFAYYGNLFYFGTFSVDFQ